MADADDASRDSVDSAAPPPIPSRRPSDLRRFDDLETSPGPPARADSDTLPFPESTPSPAPNVPSVKSHGNSEVKRKLSSPRQGQSRTKLPQTTEPGPLLQVDDTNTISPTLSPPLQSPRTKDQRRRAHKDHDSNTPSRTSRARRPKRYSFPLGRSVQGAASASQLDITALPTMSDAKDDDFTAYLHSKPTPGAKRASKYATELYTISYLIFFAILGTLSRVGLQALTFYSGAPVIFSELWANVAGTFIMGFLAEDRRLFKAEWGSKGARLPEPSRRPSEPDSDYQIARARHTKTKKTIPMYIGLATGFCGSFTSFSSFMRDIFLSLSNDLRVPVDRPDPIAIPVPSATPTLSRNGGYSFMAICATIIITVATCYSALKVGAHFALLVDPITPSLPFRFTRRIVDPLFVFLGWGIWIGAIVMVVLPPHDAWRGQALFACVFAPVGCLARYYISLPVNAIVPTFPLGTFTVNIFGTAVLGMAYDLQHVSLSGTGVVGGSMVGCQALQGIMDGFCGSLTTVSTWILEIDALRKRHAYIYGSVSVATGLCLLVAVMGSVRWTVGWQAIICTT